MKVLNNFPKVWEPKNKAIQEARDMKNLGWDELLGILRFHEVQIMFVAAILGRKKSGLKLIPV